MNGFAVPDHKEAEQLCGNRFSNLCESSDFVKAVLASHFLPFRIPTDPRSQQSAGTCWVEDHNGTEWPVDDLELGVSY